MDKVKEGKTVIEHIDTDAMIGEPLTKSLASKLLDEHVISMVVLNSFCYFGIVEIMRNACWLAPFWVLVIHACFGTCHMFYADHIMAV